MQLYKIEEIFRLLSECNHLYNTSILPEKRGFRGNLLKIRKNLMEIKRLITGAKEEVNQHIKIQKE